MSNIEHWRAENRPEGACVVSDQDEPDTVMALCGRQQDAEQIAAALNNHEDAVGALAAGDLLADAIFDGIDIPLLKKLAGEYRHARGE